MYLILAQAIADKLTLVSSDRKFEDVMCGMFVMHEFREKIDRFLCDCSSFLNF